MSAPHDNPFPTRHIKTILQTPLFLILSSTLLLSLGPAACTRFGFADARDISVETSASDAAMEHAASDGQSDPPRADGAPGHDAPADARFDDTRITETSTHEAQILDAQIPDTQVSDAQIHDAPIHDAQNHDAPIPDAARPACQEGYALTVGLPCTLTFGDHAATDIQGVTYDNTIEKGKPTINFGAWPDHNIDGDPVVRLLLRFDLSAIPRGSSVTTARLHLWVRVCSGCELSSGTVKGYPLLEAWNEGNEKEAPGACNYQERKTGVPWSGAGATGASRSSKAALTIQGGTQCSTVNTPCHADIDLAVVKSWIDTPKTNYGLVFDSLSSDGLGLYASENPVAAHRPYLVVSFTP